jgi:hypothetical protein
MNSAGTATVRPNAVQFMASEILAADRTQQAEQCRKIRERRKVMSTLLELREDFHHAFLHGLLDVLTAPDGALQRKTGAEQPGQSRLLLACDLARLVEVTSRDRRLDLRPQGAILRAHPGDRDVTLYRDRGTDRSHGEDRHHEYAARGEEPNN